MDDRRFEELLNGDAPTLDEYAGFVSVVEKLPGELLWQIVNRRTAMNWVLKSVVVKRLQEVVRRENVDNALDAIITRLVQGG